MKIVRSDSEHLVIAHFPLVLTLIGMGLAAMAAWIVGVAASKASNLGVWGGLAGVLAGLAVAAFVALLAKHSTYDFDLLGRQLLWSRRGVFGVKEGTIPFDQIHGAIVETSNSGDGGPTYRPSLMTAKGPFPLVGYYSNGPYVYTRCQQLVDAVNAALAAGHEPTAPSAESAFGQFAEAAAPVDDGEPNTAADSAALSEGAPIGESPAARPDSAASDVSAAIEEEILNLIATGRKIEAIKVVRRSYHYDLVQAKEFVEGLARWLGR